MSQVGREGNLTLWTCNPNSWGTCQSVLSWVSEIANRQAKRAANPEHAVALGTEPDDDGDEAEDFKIPQLVAVQETKLKHEHQVASAQTWCEARGWKSVFGRAVSTGPTTVHASAGTSLIADNDLVIQKIEAPKGDAGQRAGCSMSESTAACPWRSTS